MFSAAPFIAAVISLLKVKDLETPQRMIIERASDILKQNEIFLKTESLTGIVYGTCGVSIIVGLIALVGRMCYARYSRASNKILACLVR